MGILLLSGVGNAGGYSNKLLSLFGSSIVSYLPLWEPSGSVAADISGNGYNGAYTAVTLGQTGIGDGRTAAGFDGSTSFANWYSAGLNSNFNGQLFSVGGWVKVSAAGVWTDATARTVCRLRVDASNDLNIARTSTDNIFRVTYVAGGVSKSVSATISPTGWFHWMVTVTLAGDALKFYINGALIGSPQTGLGTWAGALTSTVCTIGAVSTAPGSVWSGTLAHVPLLNRVATDAEVLTAATVP